MTLLPHNLIAVGTKHCLIIFDRQLRVKSKIDFFGWILTLLALNDFIIIGTDDAVYICTLDYHSFKLTYQQSIPSRYPSSIQKIFANSIMVYRNNNVKIYDITTQHITHQFDITIPLNIRFENRFRDYQSYLEHSVVTTATVIDDGKVAIGTDYGFIFIWDLGLNTKRTYWWEQTIDHPIIKIENLKELGLLLISTEAGQLFFLNPENGQFRFLPGCQRTIYRFLLQDMEKLTVRGTSKHDMQAVAQNIENMTNKHITEIQFYKEEKGFISNLLAMSHFNRKIVTSIAKPDSKLRVITFASK